MTRVTICKTPDGAFRSFSVSGHAEYAEEGEDIVCAGISMLTINTIHSIDLLTGTDVTVTQDPESAEIRCSFPDTPTEQADLLMKSYELGVTQIEKKYGSEYIEVEIKEV